MNEFLRLMLVMTALCFMKTGAVDCFNCTFIEGDMTTNDCREGAVAMRHLITCEDNENFCSWSNASIPEDPNTQNVTDDTVFVLSITRSCSSDEFNQCFDDVSGVTCGVSCEEDGCNGDAQTAQGQPTTTTTTTPASSSTTTTQATNTNSNSPTTTSNTATTPATTTTGESGGGRPTFSTLIVVTLATGILATITWK